MYQDSAVIVQSDEGLIDMEDGGDRVLVTEKEYKQKRRSAVTVERVEQVCKLFQQSGSLISGRSIGKYLGQSAKFISTRPDLAAVIARYNQHHNAKATKGRTRSKGKSDAQLKEGLRQTEPPIKITYQPPSWTPAMGREIERQERLKKRLSYRPRVGEE